MSAKPLRYWTAARTHYREELRAAHHVERQQFEWYLPYTYELRDAGRTEARTLMFPGFIFIRLRPAWQALASTRGIARLMLNCGMPSHILNAEIAWLRRSEDRHGVVRLTVPPRRGDHVRATQGVCNGFIGLVRDTTADGRLKVLFEVLGRKVTTEYSPGALEVLRAA